MERNLARFARLAKALLGERVATIVELGARDCRETLDLAALFPAARVFAFECNPDTLPSCRAAVAGRANIRLIEKAVADHDGTTNFFAVDRERSQEGVNDPDPGRSSLYRSQGIFERRKIVQKEVAVDVTRLDTFARAAGISAIDLLWMDIQGAELAALRGLGALLESVGLIHTEVEFVPIYAGQPLFADVRRFLADNGFSFAGFTDYQRMEADAVFANRHAFGLLALGRALAANPLLVRKRLTYARHRLKRRLGIR